MSASEPKPTVGQRLNRRFPMAAWFFDVARGIPNAAWSALDLGVGIVGIVAILGTLAGVGEVDASWALVMALVLFGWYVLRLNYAQVTALKQQHNEQMQWYVGRVKETLDHDAWSMRLDMLTYELAQGMELLQRVSIASEEDAKVVTHEADDWVGAVEHLLKDDPDDLAYFTAERHVPSTATGWHGTLYEFLTMRVQRLNTLWRRAAESKRPS